jgi:hypothetical protein
MEKIDEEKADGHRLDETPGMIADTLEIRASGDASIMCL